MLVLLHCPSPVNSGTFVYSVLLQRNKLVHKNKKLEKELLVLRRRAKALVRVTTTVNNRKYEPITLSPLLMNVLRGVDV